MRIIEVLLVFGLLTGVAPVAQAADMVAPESTPPRLGFVDGQVSFWRPGATDWAQAQVNTPLAPGDELSTGSPGNLELQIGARAFVRAWAATQLGLANQEPDFLQFTVTAGHAAFDLRTLAPGTTVEVDTPHAVFSIEHVGYYRVDVTGERTAFITRRAGQATVTPASGVAVMITPSEEVVIEGTASSQVTSYAAPPLDAWDRWNYARTDTLLDAVSARYVAPGTYGASDLDPYGTWRVVPTYGSVWVPTAVPSGWVPYSTGSWTLDPVYGWTWVDTAPWGWAPYHYGRWVFEGGFWAWAPGPVVTTPVYAPALVGFFGGPSVGLSIGLGGPIVGWVALGWGEPVVPWWGRAGFIHEPSWRGWGGPRVVNNVVINNTTVVNVQTINIYRNTSVQNAVVVVPENHFGHGPITSVRVSQLDVQRLQPIHTAPQIAATPASFVPTASRGIRPPEDSVKRAVVATRAPHAAPAEVSGGTTGGPAGGPRPAPRLVSVPPSSATTPVPPRPSLGQSGVERPMTDRARPPSPPRLGPTPGAPSAPPGQGPKPPVVSPTPGAPPPSGRVQGPQVASPSPGAPSAPPGQGPKPPVVSPTPGAPPPSGRVQGPQVASPSPGAPSAPPGQGPKPPVVSPTPGAPPPSGRVQGPQGGESIARRAFRPPGRARSRSGEPTPGAPPPSGRVQGPQVASPSPGAPSAPPGQGPKPPVVSQRRARRHRPVESRGRQRRGRCRARPSRRPVRARSRR